jgi:glycerol kinase
MTKFIGAIDQGTTSTRFMIFDDEGVEVARAQKEHRQILPRPGWVEHDPVEIIENTREVIGTACRKINVTLSGIGITNQRETALAWDRRTGRPLSNAIVWQDTRTDSFLRELKSKGLEDVVREKTGLPLATYFSAAKMRWLLDNVDSKDVCLGTIDSWLIWNLTGGNFVTDVSNASRTSLMNLRSGDWDEELLEIFGIGREFLPEILASADSARYGEVSTIDEIRGLSVAGCLGDQQAALVGQACFHPGEVKNTYGTGNFMLMNTGTEAPKSKAGLLATACYRWADQPTTFGLEGSIAVTGSAVQWLRDQLGIIDTAADIEPLAGSVADSGGVYFVPAFSGLFAPFWRSDARGVIVGLTRHSTKAHIARAALEAICFQTRDVLDAMKEDTGIEIENLKVDGGATANNTLMQMQADILGVTVIRPKTTETTALGAAYAAGLALGIWNGTDELQQHWREDSRWEPTWTEDQRTERFRTWRKAVERSLDWIEFDEDR